MPHAAEGVLGARPRGRGRELPVLDGAGGEAQRAGAGGGVVVVADRRRGIFYKVEIASAPSGDFVADFGVGECRQKTPGE